MEALQNIDVGNILIQFVVLLFSLSIHEASHAWVADRCGDDTARHLGRVTLNPIVHMDLVGTVLFPLLQFIANIPLIGWAKPVPVNSVRLTHPQRDQVLVSLAGPGANLAAAAASFTLLAVLKFASPLAGGLMLNIIQTMHVPHHESVLAPIVGVLVFTLIINLALALFNVIPIPPLDGHWLLYAVLPHSAWQAVERISAYSFLLLYALMFMGLFRFILVPVRWTLLALVAI